MEPPIDQVLAEKTEVLFNVELDKMDLPPMTTQAFDTIICAECGEVIVGRYARVKHGKIVWKPYAENM